MRNILSALVLVLMAGCQHLPMPAEWGPLSTAACPSIAGSYQNLGEQTSTGEISDAYFYDLFFTHVPTATEWKYHSLRSEWWKLLFGMDPTS